jgi:hypothetical protein
MSLQAKKMTEQSLSLSFTAGILLGSLLHTSVTEAGVRDQRAEETSFK